MRIAILPTGRAEWLGMATALKRLFPDHDFYCLPTKDEIESNPERFPLSGFTSTLLNDTSEQQPPESVRELIGRAAQALIGTRHQEAADLVIILDDLELPNARQPDRVVRVMRSAVKAHLLALASQSVRERTAERLRQKVSFHIVAPMLEAWFFADPEALTLAGVPHHREVIFTAATDPEEFVTTDAAYTQTTAAACPGWLKKQKRNDRPKWLGGSDRLRHPKGYLQWLCLNPLARNCTTYSETNDGAKALAGLDWANLLARPEDHFQLLRALLDDLEYTLGECSCGSNTGLRSPHTSLRSRPSDAVLRNL